MAETFPQTAWELVDAARGSAGGARAAREALAERYHAPVNRFLRLLLRDDERAADMTQDFFERGFARVQAGADPARGRFRDYLKQALRNHVRSAMRGVPVRLEPVDERLAGGDDPFAAFDREWTRALLQRALDDVRRRCEARGQEVHFQLFAARYLGDEEKAPRWRALGVAFGLDEKQAQRCADTVARHFRDVLRGMVVTDEGSEAAANDEIAALLASV